MAWLSAVIRNSSRRLSHACEVRTSLLPCVDIVLTAVLDAPGFFVQTLVVQLFVVVNLFIRMPTRREGVAPQAPTALRVQRRCRAESARWGSSVTYHRVLVAIDAGARHELCRVRRGHLWPSALHLPSKYVDGDRRAYTACGSHD
eukprot:COSAG02_NODE_5015_length_4723_cov_3.671064_6_plen_145_part_00